MKDLRKFSDLWHKMMFILSPVHKRLGIVVFILALMGSFAELLGVSVILPLAQVMVEPDTLRANRYVSAICGRLEIVTNQQLMIMVTLFVILMYLFKNAFLAFLAWVRVKYATKVQRELSLKMINSYLSRGFAFLRVTNYSVIVRGCEASIIAIYQIIDCFFRILTDSVSLILIFMFIALTDPVMAVSMMGVALVTLFFVIVIFRKSVKRAGNIHFERQAITTKWMRQLFFGIKEILVMNKADYFTRNYEENYYKQQQAGITQTLSQNYPTYFIETLCMTGLMATVCVRMLHMDEPGAYVANLAAIAVAAFRILPGISRISSTFNYFLFQIPAANEVYDNMREAAECAPEAVEPQNSDHDDAVFSDKLQIENVSFMYPDGQDYVLNDISLTIDKGDAVAFVGPSGSGKSTLADIILGLYPLEKGTVKMDGLDILKNRTMWSRNVGFVPQSVYLMDDTVRRNIAFGLSDEEIDDDKVWRSLKQAQMSEYIESLPDGLDTIVGERGVKFSGGQAQRLAIARAMYNDPQILVLDEATSALDNSTEHAVMDAVNELQGHKTLIIIAHRLTTVKNCDHIYEISGGKISEKKYEELN